MKKFNIILTILAFTGINAFAAGVIVGSKGSAATKTSGAATAGSVITGINDVTNNLASLATGITQAVYAGKLQEAEINKLNAEAEAIRAGASSKSGDDEEIKGLKKALRGTAKSVDTLKEALSINTKNIEILFENMSILEKMINNGIKGLGIEVKASSKDISNVADFANELEGRLDTLEKKSKQGVDLSELESKISNLEKLSKKVTNLEDALNRIEDLEKKVNEINDVNEIKNGFKIA